MTRKILSQPAWSGLDGGELSPGPRWRRRADPEWVAADAETALHPSCTCRMGTDELAVVDPLTMGVHGVDGLRVVDASVFPYVTNGNIYAPVMMTAEKAADLILGNTPLARGAGGVLPARSGPASSWHNLSVERRVLALTVVAVARVSPRPRSGGAVALSRTRRRSR